MQFRKGFSEFLVKGSEDKLSSILIFTTQALVAFAVSSSKSSRSMSSFMLMPVQLDV